MIKFVLDTSIFVNPDVRKKFGETPTEAMKTFLHYAENLFGKVEFYMPPGIYRELMHFVEEEEVSPDIELYIIKKPPNVHDIKIPAFVVYELIEDIRRRVDKGLRVAEKAVRESVIDTSNVDKIIQKLRRNYRKALREGILDSKEDFELILLAKEIDGIIVSADVGILTWAEKMGIKWVDAFKFKEVLSELVEKFKRSESEKERK
ncbi:RNA ligase partner protein [Pyrococcus horikoshii]|uniref:RNA-free ribonuclease P n=2 Tax=Pyrococcus horikoshii TaxID=53953 RepID=RFRNP_PYRHO|nr:RNA ligase partner protein [Pyrococcus horikoshii]O59517.2 RecName: Full=RNA-free ribonuclease P; Short=RNA-free RNase P; AltName: Full=Protein-only RNase P [Pyrococcus horikoshii OT3]HII60798.1 RNA ligase partner protein [Pyrococcus horikoshii]